MSTSFVNNTVTVRQSSMSNPFALYNFANQNQARPSSFIKRIDQELLKVGIFCFLVPLMFIASAFVRESLLIEDVIEFKYYILASLFAARIAMTIIMNKIAKQKNRNTTLWMLFAAIFPNLSLIGISIAGNAQVDSVKQAMSTPENQETKMPAQSTGISKEVAREIYMFRRAKAC